MGSMKTRFDYQVDLVINSKTMEKNKTSNQHWLILALFLKEVVEFVGIFIAYGQSKDAPSKRLWKILMLLNVFIEMEVPADQNMFPCWKYVPKCLHFLNFQLIG